MVSDVTLSGAAAGVQKTADASTTLGKDFTQFLNLLTTQLQNQDPLNPMDSAEFTNQLVQFSQVEQQINSNQKLDSLVNLQLSSMHAAALGYVGMDITYVSADMNYDGTNPVDVSYGLTDGAATAKMNVYDEDGNLVFSKAAPSAAGSNKISWDGSLTDGGKAEAGTYSVKIDALDSEGKAVTTTTAVTGHVRGIESQDGIVYLLVGDRAVTIGNVINASEAPKSASTETDGGSTS